MWAIFEEFPWVQASRTDSLSFRPKIFTGFVVVFSMSAALLIAVLIVRLQHADSLSSLFVVAMP